MLTAYSTKGELSDERTVVAIQAFFSEHFGHFVGKHTQWLLMDEPKISKMTPIVLNKIRNDLIYVYKTFLSKDNHKKDKSIFHQDLN